MVSFDYFVRFHDDGLQVFRTRSGRRKEGRRVETSVTKEGRRVEESRRRGIRIQPTVRSEKPNAAVNPSKKHQQGPVQTSTVLSFSQPPPLSGVSTGEEEKEEKVFLLPAFPSTTTTTTSTTASTAPVHESLRHSGHPASHSTLSIEKQPTHTIASHPTHLTDQHSKQVQTSVQPAAEHFREESEQGLQVTSDARRSRKPEAYEVYDTTNTFKPSSYPAKDTFQPAPVAQNVPSVEAVEDDFGDTAVAPQAEPLSFQQGGEAIELSEREKKEVEEERRRGIEEWMASRRGVKSSPPSTSLLPTPIQIHQAVPSLEEQEEIDLIDQIFDDAIFGASEVSEVKRKVEDLVRTPQEQEGILPDTEEMESDASDLIYDVFHEEKESSEVDHGKVWKNIETKFEQLPLLYRSQIKYQPAKKASSEKKWQLSTKQKSLERKYSATPVPLTPLPTTAPHIQVTINLISIICIVLRVTKMYWTGTRCA